MRLAFRTREAVNLRGLGKQKAPQNEALTQLLTRSTTGQNRLSLLIRMRRIITVGGVLPPHTARPRFRQVLLHLLEERFIGP